MEATDPDRRPKLFINVINLSKINVLCLIKSRDLLNLWIPESLPVSILTVGANKWDLLNVASSSVN